MNTFDDTPPVPPEGSAEAPRSSLRQWQVLALAAGVLLLAGLMGQAAGRVAPRSPALAVVLAIIAGLVFIGIAVTMVAGIVRLRLSWAQQLALAIIFGGISAAWGLARIELLKDLFLFVAATFFGALTSRIIKERNILVPVAVVAAGVDIWGVYWGFVNFVGKKAPQVVEHLSAAVPGANAVEMPIPLLSAIGVGDFLFMGLFVGAVSRLEMNSRGTLWALFIAFLTAPVVFSLVGASALPGLPLLGAAVLIANWRQFRFSRAEKFALLYAALAVMALVAVMWAAYSLLKR